MWSNVEQRVARRHGSMAFNATQPYQSHLTNCRVQEVVALLRQRLPTAQIVLLGLLPRGTGTAEGLPVWDNDHSWPSVYTEAMAAVNEQLR